MVYNVARVFFHSDMYFEGPDTGNTVLYEPRHRAVIAYKANRYFLIGGQSGPDYGISSWANGKKGNGAAGTWGDAEDGVLRENPIEQGSVDSTLALDPGSAARTAPRILNHRLRTRTPLRDG